MMSTEAWPANFSLAAATASKRSSLQSTSTWAYERTRVVPRAIIRPRVSFTRSCSGTSALRQFWRSFIIMVHTPGPPVCSRNGRPIRVESRCTWTSEKEGSRSRPRPSTTVKPSGTDPGGVMRFDGGDLAACFASDEGDVAERLPPRADGADQGIQWLLLLLVNLVHASIARLPRPSRPDLCGGRQAQRAGRARGSG